MSDWAPGDLAAVVDPTLSLKHGEICRVASVCCGGTGLNVEGHVPDCHAFRASRFSKIRPDKHEDCEPEFVTLLKRSKVSA
jgi:hypothetical protein